MFTDKSQRFLRYYSANVVIIIATLDIFVWLLAFPLHNTQDMKGLSASAYSD